MTTPTGQKRDAALKAALGLEIVLKNPIFSSEHIEELFNMFYLYAEPRTSKADIRDVLVTARALGLDKKYELVFRAIEEVSEVHHGDKISFESFIKDLTRIIVSILLFREIHSPEREEMLPLIFWIPKEKVF
jgi:Ca2+-binding EF-hand superfamily protein